MIKTSQLIELGEHLKLQLVPPRVEMTILQLVEAYERRGELLSAAYKNGLAPCGFQTFSLVGRIQEELEAK